MNQPPLDRSTLRLLKQQHGRCVLCGELLLHADREPHSPEEWQQWHRTTRKAITRHVVRPGTVRRRLEHAGQDVDERTAMP
jgi:RNA-directed DNA polymerase